MDIYDIMEMLKFGESWTVEFKEILPKPSKLAHTIVAFANHQGGTILIGVNDIGEPVGFEATREHYEDILRAAREAVIPSIHYEEIKKVEVYGKHILAIKVPQGIDQVYSTSDGKYLVRENVENVRVDWQKLYARNPNIMLVLLEWGYSEGIGRGIDDIFESMKQGGYRLPKMEDTGTSFIFTLYGKDFDVHSKISKNVMRILNDRQKNALKYIKEKGKITNRVYRDLNRVSNVIAVNELKALVQEGVLKQEGAGRSTRYVLENEYS